MADPRILEVKGVSVRFGGVRAVSDIDFGVAPAEVVGLVGPNGSGKSTFLNALSGLVDATGEAWIGGTRLPFSRPGVARRLGVLRTFQTAQIVGELTCLENVLLSTSDRRQTGLVGAWFRQLAMGHHEQARWEAAWHALEAVGLTEVFGDGAGTLPAGSLRLLELARTIVAQPAIILLDEPSAGLNAAETRGLGEILAKVRSTGVALLVVDHKTAFLDELCDRIVVLQLGRVIAEGEPGHIWNDVRVADAYLGGTR